MSLIECRECHAKVSTEARCCPSCGAKIRKPVGLLGMAFVGAIVLAVIVSWSPSQPKPSVPQKTPEQLAEQKRADGRFQRAVVAMKSLAATAHDPKSIEWSSVLANDDASLLCITFRAKNSFGATVLQRAVIEGAAARVDDKSWNRLCANRELNDVTFARRAL